MDFKGFMKFQRILQDLRALQDIKFKRYQKV